MPKTLRKPNKPLFVNVFPSWKGRQPVDFFMLDNLLSARMGSEFPTNGAGPDEDVNVFLAGLLTRFLSGRQDGEVVFGADSLLHPPSCRLSRRQRAEYYLANANCRLLYLGLFNRGDDVRRRRIPFGRTEAEARARDLAVGRECYRMAANLLSGRSVVSAGLVAVLEKLGENFEGYAQVLAVMATRKLGLGARLSDIQLGHLLDGPEAPSTTDWPPPVVPAGHPDMDHLLDLMLQYGRDPEPQLELRLRAAARRVGADAEKIIRETSRT